MSRPSNQEIEKYYFELFTKDFILPNGELEYGDKPDVIIRSTKKLVLRLQIFIWLMGQLKLANKSNVSAGKTLLN